MTNPTSHPTQQPNDGQPAQVAQPSQADLHLPSFALKRLTAQGPKEAREGLAAVRHLLDRLGGWVSRLGPQQAAGLIRYAGLAMESLVALAGEWEARDQGLAGLRRAIDQLEARLPSFDQMKLLALIMHVIDATSKLTGMLASLEALDPAPADQPPAPTATPSPA